MSLRYALLNLLASEPMSGYDLTRQFAVSLANVWPAQHSQIYPELARLADDGLIHQTDQGPRGRKVYATTPKGVDALRAWMRDVPPDYGVRSEAMLRTFCLWTLPRPEAIAQIRRDRVEYRRHLDELTACIATVDWGANGGQRSGRLAIEYGARFYQSLLDWSQWAEDQIGSGALEPDGPLPAGAGGHRAGGQPVGQRGEAAGSMTLGSAH